MQSDSNSLKSFIRDVERKIELFLTSLITIELPRLTSDKDVVKYATIIDFLLKKKEMIRNVNTYESAREIQSQVFRLMEGVHFTSKQ